MTSAEMPGSSAAGARPSNSLQIVSNRRNVERRASFYVEPGARNLSKSAPIDIPGVKKRERDRQQDREQATSRADAEMFARMRLSEMDLRMSYSRSRSENGGVPLSAASSTRSWTSDIADDPCEYGDPSYIAYTYDYEMRRARYGAHLVSGRGMTYRDDEEEGDDPPQRRAEVGAVQEGEEDEDDEDDEDGARRDATNDDLDLVFNIELH